MTTVRILIPYYNGKKWLSDLLRSLVITKHPHEIVVADDASTEEHEHIVQDNVSYVTNEENLGFVGNVNQWAQTAMYEGKHLLLLNQDMALLTQEEDWLTWMVEDLETKHETDNAVAVGPLLTYGLNTQVKQRVHRWELPFPTWVPALSGAALLVHKNTELYLNKDLNRQGLDDMDWAIERRREGRTLWVNHNVLFWHESQQEGRQGDYTEDAARYMQLKWGEGWRQKYMRMANT